MLGDLISAGAKLIGGFFGDKQREAGQEKEIELQKEFAKNGLRWKVEDAKAAGLHPLAALGSSGAAYSPVGLGSNTTAESMGSAGQDISRAVDTTRTMGERVDAYTKTSQALSLERQGLENQLLRVEILNAGRSSSPPFPGDTYPMPGQPGSAVVHMPSPFGLPPMRVANPEMAEQAQTHFGDVAEEIYGPLNWTDSLARSVVDGVQQHIRDVTRGGKPGRGIRPR